MAKIRLYSADMSRREALTAVAGLAGLGFAGAAQAAKKKQRPQADVAYQDHPHGKERCDNCEPFIAPNKCRTVEGIVSAQGWCNIYVEK